MKNDIKPTAGRPTPRAIPQSHINAPKNQRRLPSANEDGEKAITGGKISTAQFKDNETRPPEMHASLNYVKTTATVNVPTVVEYDELTDLGATLKRAINMGTK